MDLFTNFWVSLLCCGGLYLAGLGWLRLRQADTDEYLTWLKWNLILCPLLTWPLFGLLLGWIFPDPNGGLLGLL